MYSKTPILFVCSIRSFRVDYYYCPNPTNAMMLCLQYNIEANGEKAFQHSQFTQAQTKAHKGTKAQSTKAQKYKKAKVKMEKAKAVIAF